MSATKIEWTDATWNPIAGCSVISPGCTNCYAMRMAARIEAMGSAPHYNGLTMKTKAGAVWTGKIAVAPESILLQPLRWKKPRRIFVNSMSDLFHENVPDTAIDEVFRVMATAERHTFQVLTKRSARMRDYMSRAAWLTRYGRQDWMGPRPLPLPNVWLGVSTEDQSRANERIPDLLATPAAVRFISAEPLLGPLDVRRISIGNGIEIDALTGYHSFSLLNAIGLGERPRASTIARIPILPAPTGRLNWIIAGGESGPHARPMHPDWIRSLCAQCLAVGVPFFFKQWGEWLIADTDSTMDFRFGDGEPFPIVSDGHDMIMSEAQGHRGAPVRIWRDYWATGGGHLAKRPGKKSAGAVLDGREWRAFPQ